MIKLFCFHRFETNIESHLIGSDLGFYVSQEIEKICKKCNKSVKKILITDLKIKNLNKLPDNIKCQIDIDKCISDVNYPNINIKLEL